MIDDLLIHDDAAPAPSAADDVPVTDDSANKKYKNSGVADIVFLIDATGSMQPCIDALKANINNFIDTLSNTEGNGSPVTDWRARVVGYRDYIADGGSSHGWLVDCNFTRDTGILRNQLASLEAMGGGAGEEGIPESLLDAMMTVAATGEIDLQAVGNDENTNKWRPLGSAARVVIVFTDAPYHPTMSIPGYEGAGVKDLYNVYNQARIKPYFFVPPDASYIMLGRFRGAMLTQCDNLDATTANQAEFQKLLEQLAKGVSQSASAQVRVAL